VAGQGKPTWCMRGLMLVDVHT